MIRTVRKPEYVINEVSGNVTLRELLEYAQQNVDEWISDSVLWDLSPSTMSEDSSDYPAVSSLVGNIHHLAEKRKGRKTVFLAPEPLAYGMLRMALMIVESIEARMVAAVFQTREEAEGWLREGA
jgi:hypothetical protein